MPWKGNDVIYQARGRVQEIRLGLAIAYALASEAMACQVVLHNTATSAAHGVSTRWSLASAGLSNVKFSAMDGPMDNGVL
jgi:hypothetical protein